MYGAAWGTAGKRAAGVDSENRILAGLDPAIAAGRRRHEPPPTRRLHHRHRWLKSRHIVATALVRTLVGAGLKVVPVKARFGGGGGYPPGLRNEDALALMEAYDLNVYRLVNPYSP